MSKKSTNASCSSPLPCCPLWSRPRKLTKALAPEVCINDQRIQAGFVKRP